MLRTWLSYAGAAILGVSLVITLVNRGGPYFSPPETAYDHTSRERHPTRDDILVCRRVAPLIPRGSAVTIIRPADKDTTTHLDTAVGLLPYQRIVAPSKDPEYVITIRESIDDPRYGLVQSFPEGNLYRRR
jgi:hypothetical protein